uniref:Uncharacterized protein n=1 Tax=Rhizophora mucronata TaxID=61149 RepID=A0A2P2QFB7_RHIMU
MGLEVKFLERRDYERARLARRGSYLAKGFQEVRPLNYEAYLRMRWN